MEVGDKELSLPELIGDVTIEIQPTKPILSPSRQPEEVPGAAWPHRGLKERNDTVRR